MVLVEPVRQRLWGWPAVANFTLGGLGAGLYTAAAVGGTPGFALARWLGPALVLAGFLAVAAEAGRPLRGPRVLARPRTSWMSRELWLGLAFAGLAAADAAGAAGGLRRLAVLAALALALAQGAIVRAARGVPAWAVGVMPPLFLSSALVSGAGLLALLEVARGVPPVRLLGAVQVLLVVHAVLWWAYLTWSDDPAFACSVRPLASGRRALAIVAGGVLAPVACTALALAWPEAGRPLAAAGAALAVAGQAYAKGALILEAGWLRPITAAQLGRPRRLA